MPKDFKALRDIAKLFYRPDQKRYGIAIYTDNSHDGLAARFESLLFSYGGELGDYSNYKVNGFINSDKAIAALEAYKELYKFTPPGWANSNLIEDNQAITENLAAMSMNFFAFFPSLINEASNPNAKGKGFFANPAGPNGDKFAPLGGQGISIVSYPQKQEEAFNSSSGSSRTRHRRSGQRLAATPAAPPCSSRRNSRTPRRTTRPSTRPRSR